MVLEGLFLFFSFFPCCGFELRASCLVDRWLYHMSHSDSDFCVGYFQDRVSPNSSPGLALNCDPTDLCLLATGTGWVLVAHACNPSYTGGRDQEDHGLKLALKIV
jgi:hypothetical protein